MLPLDFNDFKKKQPQIDVFTVKQAREGFFQERQISHVLK